MSVLQVVSIENERGTPVLFQVPFVVASVVVSQCSSRAVILSSDGRVFSCVVEIPHSMRIVGFPAGVAFPIKQVAIAPSGRYLCAVDARGRVFLEDVDGQKPMARVAAVDQVVSVTLTDKQLVALDVTGHVWTGDTGSWRSRRITEKSSVPSCTITASPLHVLCLGKPDRAIRRCSFTETDSSYSPLMIPGVSQDDVDIQAFPSTVSSGDDFLVASGDSRLFWLAVKLERFHLKPLDLPDDFRFKTIHATVRGIFLIGDRGAMHRLDWEVLKDKTDRITKEMLIPFAVVPVPALLSQQRAGDVRPEKVAFGLVHALFLWVENDPDRKGELKALLSEISAVLQETHEIKKKLSALPSSVLPAALPDRERLLRDALLREVEDEREVQAKQRRAHSLSTELAESIDLKNSLSAEKTKITRELENFKAFVNGAAEEVELLKALRSRLRKDVERTRPLVEELRTKIQETGDAEKRRSIQENVKEIDSRLLMMASELNAKKMLLSKLIKDRDSVMQIFHETYAINTL